ncbi:hypothetical protein MMC09_005707 [Bachmanniomyces sp. S44760]|nr:hypothetical protein [Bachmanniomyces sp. S44760]
MLDIQALNLLFSLATPGSSASSAVFLPPPQHLALISTLVVHPLLNTRAKTPDQLAASDLAIKYLRHILNVVGPGNSKINSAFTFTGESSSLRTGRQRRKQGSPEPANAENINIELATTSGIWARAEDFWQVVGWAFNCSVLHKNRWARWQMWLDLMISILTDDWESRDDDNREESLIVTYLTGPDRISPNLKRIIRAIFADGSLNYSTEFQEIWKNEPKERVPKDKDSGKGKNKMDMNIDEGRFDDYPPESNSEDDVQEGTVGPSSKQNVDISPSSQLGGSVALSLRLRLLSLLSAVSYALPSLFTPIATLYDLYMTEIRSLPLPLLLLFLSPNSLQNIAPEAASALIQRILRSLIASAAPLPKSDNLTQDVLERCYLPYPANTQYIVDNVKVSLCIEALCRMLNMWVEGGMEWRQSLQDAVERGCTARESKAKKERGKKEEGGGPLGRSSGVGDEGEMAWLKASSKRMRATVETMRIKAGLPEVGEKKRKKKRKQNTPKTPKKTKKRTPAVNEEHDVGAGDTPVEINATPRSSTPGSTIVVGEVEI